MQFIVNVHYRTFVHAIYSTLHYRTFVRVVYSTCTLQDIVHCSFWQIIGPGRLYIAGHSTRCITGRSTYTTGHSRERGTSQSMKAQTGQPSHQTCSHAAVCCVITYSHFSVQTQNVRGFAGRNWVAAFFAPVACSLLPRLKKMDRNVGLYGMSAQPGSPDSVWVV